MSKLVCVKTGETYSINEVRWQSDSKALLDINFTPNIDIYKIRQRPANIWRYREAIPLVYDENIISFGEGATPLQAMEFNHRKTWIKLDYLFPTGSYKDRGASVLMSKAKELGITQIVQDSSGNAGAAIAAYGAKAEITCNIYVPHTASENKIAQIQMYGAKIHRIKGTRQEVAQAALKAAEEGLYYASHTWNPFFLQGTKTFAYEIAEQMGWKAPDTIILPAGNGSLLIGTYLGFKELKKAGITTHIPKIIAVQAANCNPLYTAFKENLPEIPLIQAQETLAEGIAIESPIRGMQMVQYVELSNGDFISVEEEEIKESWIELGKRGYFVEPTAAATIAGVKKYLATSDKEEVIVSTLTGSGLKTSEKSLKKLK